MGGEAGAGVSDVRHALYACREGCEGCGETRSEGCGKGCGKGWWQGCCACLCARCCARHYVPRGVPCQCSAHPERDEPRIRRRYVVLLLPRRVEAPGQAPLACVCVLCVRHWRYQLLR